MFWDARNMGIMTLSCCFLGPSINRIEGLGFHILKMLLALFPWGFLYHGYIRSMIK